MRFTSLPQLESDFLSTGNNAEYILKEIGIPVPGENLTLQGMLCTPSHRTGYFHDSPHPKERVLLHFTAGQIRSDMQALTRQDFHVSVPFVIGRNGTIYQLYSSKFWSGNIGKGRGNTANVEDKKTIGIEISNYGFLTEREGNLETIYSRLTDDHGRTGPIDIYCSLSERQAYQKLITPFREQSYYATFTPEQYESLIVLLRYLTATYNIPRQFLPEDKRFIATDDVLNFKGIVSHVNYRDSGKWDIGPAFDWTRVIQGVQAAACTPFVPATRGVVNGDVIHSEEELENLLPKSKGIEQEELLDLENARIIESEAQKKKLYALIVGINDYQETVKVGKDEVYFPKLNGCVDDAGKIQQYLEADRFYEPVIKVLKNGEATKKAVVNSMIEHLGQATDNDTVLLYFSGHGTQEKTDREVFASETDGKLECIACYYDENTKDDFLLSDKELRWLIHKIANNKPHIVTIFDCCHSGNNTRNAALLSNSFPHSIEKRIAYVFPERNWNKFIFSGLLSKEQFITEGIGKLLPEGKHFQFPACESYESAIELDNEGVFTKTLLRTLKGSGGDLTYQSLGSRIRQYMRNVFAQKPKIDSVGGDVNDLNKIFLNKPFTESKKAFGEVTYNEENGWQLNLGAINGIGKNATSIEILDAANSLQVVKAAISSIGVDYTVLSPENELDPTKIYVTNIEGITSESLRIHFDMEEGVLPEQENIFNELQKELPKSLLPEDDEQKAQYVLQYSNNQYYFTLPGNKYRPLVKPIEAGQDNTAVKLARDLKHIGSWEFLKNLTNDDPSTLLSDKVFQVDISVGITSPTNKIVNDGELIVMNYEKVGSSWKSALQVKVTNLGENILYCACLWLTSDFGASTELLDPPVKFMEGSAQRKSGSLPEAVSLMYKGNSIIPASFDKIVKWYNWKEQTEYLKFIISTEPFDATALQLEKLLEPTIPGGKRGLAKTKGIGGDDDVSANPTGWLTLQVKLVFPNPEYNSISEPDLNSMLNNPETSDFALGLYFEGDTDGLVTSLKIKPEIQVIGQNTKGIIQDKIIDLANWWSRTKRNRHFEDTVKRFPDRIKLVSEGDSWFQHPLVLDIIDHLHRVYNIYCVAAAGDTLRNYFSAEKNNGEYYRDAIDKYDPAFFLISGGGNDILGSQFSSYLNDKPDHSKLEGESPERFLKKELADEMDTLMGFYKTLFAHLQTHKPKLNIIVHGYDYPVKLNEAKKGWLGRYMIAKGIDRPGDRKAIIHYIMDEFNNRLEAVCQGFDKVTYIDLRNMVRYDEQEKLDQWYDEIHPTNDGFQQIAMKFMETIDKIVREDRERMETHHILNTIKTTKMANNDDLKKYVADLHLSTPSVSYPSTKAVGRDLVVEGEEQSFLNDKSLVSFVSAVSEQRRKDVLNSVLLAQMAANKQFPNEDQIIDWYKQFVLVLNKLGWAIEAADFSTFKSSGNVFEAESAIIDILTTAFGGNLPAVIAKTLSAIKSLADNTGKITAFDKNTHSQTKGAFQIGLAKEENGTVSLQLGTFTLTSSNEIKKILFFKSTKDSTELKYCSRQGTLDEEVYATARQAIVDKLGGKINEFVVEIDI